MKHNFHTHTTRCGHATGTEEEYVQAAIQRGLKQLGFAERELLVEFGYPTQRFVLPVQSKEEQNK